MQGWIGRVHVRWTRGSRSMCFAGGERRGVESTDLVVVGTRVDGAAAFQGLKLVSRDGVRSVVKRR